MIKALAGLCPSPQSGISRKKVVRAKTFVNFHSFFSNKVGEFLFMFLKKSNFAEESLDINPILI